MEPFEVWLRSVCFQSPTPEAYDLAKDAWIEATRQLEGELKEANERAAEICDRLAEMMESDAGEPDPRKRLRQAARMIRALSDTGTQPS